MTNAQFITEEEVQKALDHLRDGADSVGYFTQQSRITEHMVKHTLALEMKKHDGSAAHQEREARASDAYLSAILEDAKAAGELAKCKALREAAALKIEVWRSQSANYRMMKI